MAGLYPSFAKAQILRIGIGTSVSRHKWFERNPCDENRRRFCCALWLASYCYRLTTHTLNPVFGLENPILGAADFGALGCGTLIEVTVDVGKRHFPGLDVIFCARNSLSQKHYFSPPSGGAEGATAGGAARSRGRHLWPGGAEGVCGLTRAREMDFMTGRGGT